MIYFNLSCKKKDTHDYLITKCDYTISQAFFDIFHITKCGKVILLQNVTDCYYKMRQALQSMTECNYKVHQVLQSLTYVTK